MKKNITVICLLIYTLIFSQESIKVTYQTIVHSKINLDGFENIPEKYKEEIRTQALQKSKKPEKYVLYYEDGNSFLQRDPDKKLSSPEQKTEYYRFKTKDGIYGLSDYIVEEFYGHYPMDNVSIEFASETQTIENYPCKLALYKNGNNVSKVWYTEDIPVSEGPYNYYKIPGLILKIESPNYLCYAVNISKNKNDIKN